ncbi:ABC transporter F family member 4-like [Asparagus officinalis]|uniref:ABC transporter F family member 4-like n=1 Tax=Asparagus officinalis TaxID=4686 RepID=UPI00098E6DDA|nr:ABC transporter F family member 4-like [Asparagus officinalis]
MILKKSEAAIHILPEQDVARYVHEEIKLRPTTVKAKVEEEVTGEKSLGKKRVQKENEAYEKLVMLNEAYEQALVARGVDILAIKTETEKKFAEEKRIRQNKGEPQIDEALSEGDQTREMDIELEEAKVEAEKEEGKEEEGGKEGDQTQAMGSELEELKEVKVAEDVPKKEKGRKRREESDDTLKTFVSGLRAKSQRTTKKPKFLESPFQTELPKKGRKGKKGVVVVEDDDDKGEKDEEKPLAISHLGRRTSVAELWKRKKSYWRC